MNKEERIRYHAAMQAKGLLSSSPVEKTKAQKAVEWLRKAVPPPEPFQLNAWTVVQCPKRFFAKLLQEVSDEKAARHKQALAEVIHLYELLGEKVQIIEEEEFKP